MSDSQHINKLDQGVDAWNQWRKDNPEIKPDLRMADLRGKHLEGIDFSNAQLEGTNCSEAYLEGANLKSACFVGTGGPADNLLLADLRGAFLNNTANLNNIVLSNKSYIGPLLADIHWAGSILA